MNFLFLLILFFLGASIASFLNAFSYRLARGMSIARGRSACPHCKVSLAWHQLIPVISFLMLRRRCRSCKALISWQYFFAELALGGLFVTEGVLFLAGAVIVPAFILNLFIYSVLVFLFLHDLRYYILPDIVTIPSLVIIIAGRLLLGASWSNLLLAILVGAGFFAMQFLVSRGKWIGGGDIRMGALLGAIAGWPHILLTLFLAYLLGSLIALPLLVTKKVTRGAKLPFGTFLALAGMMTMWWGQEILDWYLGFL